MHRLVETPEDIPAQTVPLSRAEREALARRIPHGTPLSQVIDEEREDRF
jgi:hypothetical protein